MMCQKFEIAAHNFNWAAEEALRRGSAWKWENKDRFGFVRRFKAAALFWYCCRLWSAIRRLKRCWIWWWLRCTCLCFYGRFEVFLWPFTGYLFWIIFADFFVIEGRLNIWKESVRQIGDFCAKTFRIQLSCEPFWPQSWSWNLTV